ncbi:MAG: hypothetical protein KJ063_17345 [Anaerolineae bacterium]|nr:hypothetical protein [Anaerolineae bacterium]
MSQPSAFFSKISPILLGSGYLLLLVWFPLRPYYNKFPQYDIWQFTGTPIQGGLYALWLLGMSGLVWQVYRQVSRMTHPPRLAVVLGPAALFALFMLWVYPFNATDVYRYFIRGRVASVYQANPFTTPPAAFLDDPYLILAGEWAGHTSPYGPVWEMIAGGITSLFPQAMFPALILFKLVVALAFLGSGVLLWQLAADLPPGQRLGRVILWLWNPALLLIFVVDGHNDGVMLFWLLLGVWLWRRGRTHLAWLILPLAPLTKLIGLLALPFIFLGMWHETPNRAARLRLLGVALGNSLLLAFLAFLPYGSPLDLALRLIQESREGAGFSVLTWLYFIGQAFGEVKIGGLANIGTGLFLLLTVGLLLWGWRGRDPYRSLTDIFAGYILQALSFRIWYAAWLFPWTLTDRDERRPRVVYLFLLTTQLSVLIYAHLRLFWLDGNMAAAHLIGIPFTFGLPLLGAVFGSAYIPHSNTPQTEK